MKQIGHNNNGQNGGQQEPQQEPNKQQVDVEQEGYAKKSRTTKKYFWLITVVVYTLLYIPEVFLNSLFSFFEISAGWWHFMFAFQVAYTLASLRTQQQNEIGAKLFFGKVLYETEPGLVFVPIFFCDLMKESVNLQQWEIPTDLSELYGSDEEGKQIKTLRMTTAPAPKNGTSDDVDKKGDPLQTGRLTLEGKLIVSARIDKKSGGFTQFIERIGNMDNFLKIADDIAVNTFRKEIAKRSPSEVFVDWHDIEIQATEGLKEKIGSFGFTELDVRSKEFDLPHTVNKALATRTAAYTGVETQRLEGEGKKQHDLLVAEAVKALAAAPIAGRIEALVKAMSKDGLELTSEQAVFMAYQEVIKEAFEKANYTLLPQGQGGFLDPASMMSIMQEAVKVSQTPKKVVNGGGK